MCGRHHRRDPEAAHPHGAAGGAAAAAGAPGRLPHPGRRRRHHRLHGRGAAGDCRSELRQLKQITSLAGRAILSLHAGNIAQIAVIRLQNSICESLQVQLVDDQTFETVDRFALDATEQVQI
jgi:hypothetical protein